MRRRAALAGVAIALVAGAGTGVALRTGLPSAAVPQARPAPTSVVPTTPIGSTTPTASRTPGGSATRAPTRDDLLTVAELEAAGWRDAQTRTTVTADAVDPVVSPCQQPGPFSGLDGVVVGRWQGPSGRAGEVVAQAASIAEARRRANEAYEQHVRCAQLRGRSVGERHAITVDGGSITWFEVGEAGRAGFGGVVRQSDRFAVVYADQSQVGVSRLPDLLRDAAARLR